MTQTLPSTPDNAPPGAPAPPARRWIRRVFRVLTMLLLAFVLLAMTAWATLAVRYANLSGASPRTFRAAAFAVTAIAVLLFVRPRRYGVAGCLLLFVIVLAWFFSIRPRNDRDWAPEVAQVPTVVVDGDRMTVHNIRNFDYRSETDFTPSWVDRTYDLSKLRAADLMLCYWGSQNIAHGMVSFGFDDGQYLAVSIETRKEKSESYSAVEGFFRQYELIYVFADERDVIRLRTNYRHEDVFLYHTTVAPAKARALLMSYERRANSLAEHPEFYNALTSNCVTNVLSSAREIDPGAQRMNWEILLSGNIDRRAYRNGRFDTSMPFEELRARSRVNDAAIAADKDPDFSAIIRRGLPVPDANTNRRGG